MAWGNMNNARPFNVGALRLIRGAMLFGVLLINGVVGYLVTFEHLEVGISVPSSVAMNGLFLFMSLTALAAVIVIRNKLETVTDLAQSGRLVLVGWLIAEGAALLGAGIYLMTANVMLFLAGVLVMLMAFFLLPIPEAEDEIR